MNFPSLCCLRITISAAYRGRSLTRDEELERVHDRLSVDCKKRVLCDRQMETCRREELLEELSISCFSKPARVHVVLSREPVTDWTAEILAYIG